MPQSETAPPLIPAESQRERDFDIAILGGGFSGAMLATHLLRHPGPPRPRVALVERGERIGPGVPYNTPFVDHVLNVPAARMSAFAERSSDFVQWLHHHVAPVDGRAFVPRRLYGQYLADTLRSAEAAAPGRLMRIRSEALSLRPAPGGAFEVPLRDEPPLRAQRVVLAIGNARPANPLPADDALLRTARYVPDPWNSDALAACAGREPLLLIGTGLTAYDVTLALRALGHNAPVYALSRRGLTPHGHRAGRGPTADLRLADELAAFTAPLPAGGATPWRLSRLLRTLRTRARQSGDWRATIDQLRPLTNLIWQAMDEPTRRRFLRHARPYWDVHRHRAAPTIVATMTALLRGGGFVVLAGRITGMRPDPLGLQVEVQPRGGGPASLLRVARIINCTGPDSDLTRSNDPLIRSLLEQRLITPDRLRQGILTAADGSALTAHDGPPRLFALGALRRPREWESTAVPELRVQAAELARTLLAAHAGQPVV